MKTIKLDPAKCIPGGPYRTIRHVSGKRLTDEERALIESRKCAGKSFNADGSVSYFIKEEPMPRKTVQTSPSPEPVRYYAVWTEWEEDQKDDKNPGFNCLDYETEEELKEALEDGEVPEHAYIFKGCELEVEIKRTYTFKPDPELR